ncbi:unnamed protein product [Trichogramma brassicae]|uniref:Dipeptidase n=1 Tax=Trichogramma brassicae TaxID=86971 RepID=A0A6H5IKG9_9HYME|nr:unnamed protein product [Trichogramma brassicae]
MKKRTTLEIKLVAVSRTRDKAVSAREIERTRERKSELNRAYSLWCRGNRGLAHLFYPREEARVHSNTNMYYGFDKNQFFDDGKIKAKRIYVSKVRRSFVSFELVTIKPATRRTLPDVKSSSSCNFSLQSSEATLGASFRSTDLCSVFVWAMYRGWLELFMECENCLEPSSEHVTREKSYSRNCAFHTTCLTELPDVAPCNGTVRLPGGPCDDSPSSGSSLGPNRGGSGGGGLKGRREKMSVGELRRRRCRRLIAPAILLVAAILVGGLCVPLLLQSAPATHQQRLEVIRRLLSEVPLIDGHNDLPWNVRKFVHNQLGDVNLSSDLGRVDPWAKSDWSHTDIPRLRAGQVGAQIVATTAGAQFHYIVEPRSRQQAGRPRAVRAQYLCANGSCFNCARVRKQASQQEAKA